MKLIYERSFQEKHFKLFYFIVDRSDCNLKISFLSKIIYLFFTCVGETLIGAVGALGAGERLTVWTIPGADVASWAGKRPAMAGTQAVEPRRTGITLSLA